MTFKKGDRVEATTRTGIAYGFVYKSGAEITMVLDDGNRMLKGKPQLFKASSASVPDDSPFKSPITEPGTRVRLEDGVEAYIISADIFSAKARSGHTIYTVGQGRFTKSDMVPPVDGPSPMDKWSVRKYRANEAMSEETTAYTAEILLDGKKVIDAKNDGHGGCDIYYGQRDLVDRLEADARAWATQFGYATSLEASGLWVEWAATMKPYGFTATEYLADYRGIMDEMANPDEPFVPVR